MLMTAVLGVLAIGFITFAALGLFVLAAREEEDE